MSLDDAIARLEAEYDLEPSERVDRIGRNVAHLQD